MEGERKRKGPTRIDFDERIVPKRRDLEGLGEENKSVRGERRQLVKTAVHIL